MSNNTHPSAIVSPDARIHPTVTIGPFCVIGAVKIGAHTRVQSYVELRDETLIGEHCYIDSGVKSSGHNRIGDHVTIRYDAILARGCTVGDHTFIAPQVMTINLDHYGNEIGGAQIGQSCHIGTAAVLQAGIKLADDVVIGAQALVTRDCDDPGIYIGVPARLREPRGDGI